MGAAVFAHSFGIARAAQDLALAREADRGDARDQGCEAAGDRHRRVLDRARDEAAMQPELARPAHIEPVALRDAVVVDAERPSHMNDDAVHVLAFEAGILERRP